MGEENLVQNGDDYHREIKPKATFSLIMGVAMAVIGASFQYGYNIAVVNAPSDEIKDFFFGPANETVMIPIMNGNGIEVLTNTNETDTNDTVTFPPPTPGVKLIKSENYDHREFMWATSVAAFPFAGMFGSVLVGPVVQRHGRRGGLMVNNIISLIATVFLGFSKLANSFAMIVIGRFLVGIFAGLATGVVPMYIGEISPKQWRRAIKMLHQVLIAIGILVAQLFGLQGMMGTDALWPVLFAFTAVPSILQMATMPWIPKSPRFLLINQHKDDEARNVLVKLRGTDNVADEMDEMRQEAESEASAGQMSIIQLFQDRSLRWQLIMVLTLMICQQLSGINAFFSYTNEIFNKAGIPKGNPQDYATVAAGIANVIMTIISVTIIKWAGRKSLLSLGFGMMAFWCMAMTVILNVSLSGAATGFSYMSIVGVIGCIVGFAIGPGPIPWLVTAELFTQAARPPAFMIGCLVKFACSFLIGLGFPAVNNAAGPWVFLIFMAVCLFAMIFIAIFMPETKGKTFQEINSLFSKRKSCEMNNDAASEESSSLDQTGISLHQGRSQVVHNHFTFNAPNMKDVSILNIY